ncbi:phospholipase A2 [Streptomyces sp. NPDC057137]|uniref:phospholipase A2 n=1 Tax=Streptomyces sp. NPDC057137 TaxID=3346030 RepID=UPI00362C27EF
MRVRTVLRKTLMTAAACLALTAGATTPIATAADVRGEADPIMPLGANDFVNHPQNPPFDWSNDGCTWWPDGIFFAPCAQHDFGYRNYGRHGSTQLRLSPTPETKAWIDERFWHGMRHACITHYPEGSTARNLCLGEAKVMYDGLTAGIGQDSFY